MSAHGSVAAFAPGRVVLLGADDGPSLSIAISRGVTVRATTLPGPLLMARARDLGETDVFDAWRPGAPGEAGGWRAYLRGTAAELGAAGHVVPPARVDVSGTVARTGGLGSSAALGSALALALLALGGEEVPDRAALVDLCERVRATWADDDGGGPGGAATSLLARAGHALVRTGNGDGDGEPAAVALDLDGHVLAVVPSGARLDAGTRAERRRECADAAEALGVGRLGDATADRAEHLPEPLRSRALHVIGEATRVAAAADALRAGDLDALGPLLDASHASLRERFGAVPDRVERTVARCRAAGALGARALDGHVLALLPPGARVPGAGVAVEPSAAARLL